MSKMYGVIDGLYRCNQERANELNNRISSRNIPSTGLKPQFSMRPAATKYGYMPILDQYKKATVPSNSYTPYSTSGVFNPGNATAPWSGFSNNVNLESQLRNQIFALQKSDQSVYVPESTSDLYETRVDYTPQPQTHPLLFDKADLASFNPNTQNIGNNLFNNHTRYQIKDTIGDVCKE